MTRLRRGALARQITTTVLLPVLWFTGSLVRADVPGDIENDPVDIRTIGPAISSGQPLVPAAVPELPAASRETSNVARAQAPSASPGGNTSSSPLSNPSPATAPAAPPDDLRPPEPVKDISDKAAGTPSLSFTPEAAGQPGSKEPDAAVPSASSMPADTASPASQEQAASPEAAAAEPEVTVPRPLAQVPGSTGKPIAGKLVDPYKTRLPTWEGSVHIRRPFKLFAREQLIRNLSFRDTPVKEVIGELARRGGLNILIDASVKGKITGDLKDVTLNEAMDSVLAAAGLQNRILDNNTIMVGTMQAMTELGLNRPIARAFKLSYSHPFDVANILYTSVFNRGIAPEFSTILRTKASNSNTNNTGTQNQTSIQSNLQSLGEGGANKQLSSVERKTAAGAGVEAGEFNDENNQTSRLEQARQMNGITRAQIQEGVGFYNAATSPGSQQIRHSQETPTNYTVYQNGGGAIVIPDVKNNQVIVVGTPDDLAVAEEAIHFIDKRPKQVHIQASLIEISNQGLRQLGAQLNLQGAGLSGTLLGPGNQPLIQALPGFGSPARPGPLVTDTATNGPNSNSLTSISNTGVNNSQTNTTTFASTTAPPTANTTISNTATMNPTFTSALATAMAQAFTRTQSYSLNPGSVQTQPILGGITVPNPTNTQGFTGLLGALFPLLSTPVVGVTPLTAAQSAFNFLTLSKSAGGRANIATLPAGLGLNLNLLLQTNKAKIVANPSILVSNNTEAMIVIADEVLHKVTSVATITSVTTNVELTKAGVFLDVLPKVTEDGFVIMRLRPQISAPLGPAQTFGTPPNQTTVTLLSIRDVMNQEVRIKDGQTLVLGGLFREDEASQMAKVPYVAELPVVGALFRNTLKGRNRTELMLLVTPKIVEEEPPVVGESTNAPKQM